jgi:ankyrin repeat protein
MVNEIIEKYGEKVNETDSNGDTPLHYACLYGTSRALPKYLTFRSHHMRKTPHRTRLLPRHRSKFSNFLHTHGRYQDSFGEKPLHKAVRSGSVETLQLVSSSLDVTIPNTSVNALHFACIEGLVDVSVYLLANGLQINNLDNEGSNRRSRASSKL